MTILPLSTFDHVFCTDAVAPMQVVLLYQGEPDLTRLQECFTALAREFVGVNAVLTQLDERTLGLDLSREAAEFSVADAGPDVAARDCVRPALTELGKPVARLHVTRLGARGTAIAFSLSHTVADGYGYFLFLSALSARYRGQPFYPANCKRDVFATAPAEGPVSTAKGKLAHSGFMLAGDEPRQVMRVVPREIALSELKEGARDDPRGSFTSGDYLGALLWQEVMAGESFPETTFTCSVDLRKYRPAAGPLFFGNASFLASKTVSTDALRETPTEDVARWVRSAIEEAPKQMDAGLAELEALRQQAGVAAMSRLRGVRPDCGMVFSNLSKVPLNAVDFGSGPPIGVERTVDPAPHERGVAVFALGDRLRLLVSHP